MPSGARLKSQFPLPVSAGGSGKTTEFRKGHIDGLRMLYVGRQALTITSGSAYVNSLGRIVELATDKVFTGLTFTAGAFHHIYLYDNNGVGDIEISTVAPVLYYGAAYNKTGDTSRRYIGSVLANTTTAMWGFRHDLTHNRIDWIECQPGVAPFVVYSTFNSQTPVLVAQAVVAAVMPIQTALRMRILRVGDGTTSLWAPADAITTPGGSNWFEQQGAGAGMIEVTVSRTPATLGQFYAWTASGATAAYACGYVFER